MVRLRTHVRKIKKKKHEKPKMGKAKKGQLYIRFSKEGRAQAETSQSDGIDRVNIYIIFA